MKSFFIICFVLCSLPALCQDVRIKWEDNNGREFTVTAPSGTFSYGMLAGDRITYDYKGRVSRVGSVLITYDYKGRVSRVGTVSITYDYQGKVSKVGGLFVNYDYLGRVTGTRGVVLR